MAQTVTHFESYRLDEIGEILAHFNFLSTYAKYVELQNRDLEQQNVVLSQLKTQPPPSFFHMKVVASQEKSVGTTTDIQKCAELIPDENNNLEGPAKVSPMLDGHSTELLMKLEVLCKKSHRKLKNFKHKWNNSAAALQESLLHLSQDLANQNEQLVELLKTKKEVMKSCTSSVLEAPIAESSRVHSPRGSKGIEKKSSRFLTDEKAALLATPHRTLRHRVDHSFYHGLSSIERSRRVSGEEVQGGRCKSSSDICSRAKVTQQFPLVQNNSLPWSSAVGAHWITPPRLTATWVDFDVDYPDCPAVDTFNEENTANSSSLCRTLHRPRCDCSRHEMQPLSSMNASNSSMDTRNVSCQAVYGHSWDIISEVTLSEYDEDELDLLLKETLSHF